jgi:hypothetical protein
VLTVFFRCSMFALPALHCLFYPSFPPSIRPFIRPSMYPSTIHPSIHPTINLSFHPFVHNTGAFTTWEYALLFTRSWRSLDENDPKKDICSHRVKNMVKILGQLERQHQVSQEYETKRTSERLSSLPPRKSGAQLFTMTDSKYVNHVHHSRER